MSTVQDLLTAFKNRVDELPSLTHVSEVLDPGLANLAAAEPSCLVWWESEETMDAPKAIAGYIQTSLEHSIGTLVIVNVGGRIAGDGRGRVLEILDELKGKLIGWIPNVSGYEGVWPVVYMGSEYIALKQTKVALRSLWSVVLVQRSASKITGA